MVTADQLKDYITVRFALSPFPASSSGSPCLAESRSSERTGSLCHQSYLRDVSTIDYGASSPESIALYEDFHPKWIAYGQSHPWIRAIVRLLLSFRHRSLNCELTGQVDPVYLVAIIPPGGALPPCPVCPPGAPGEKGPALALNGVQFAWTFPDRQSAAIWAGAVRNQFPEQRLWRFDTGLIPHIFFLTLNTLRRSRER